MKRAYMKPVGPKVGSMQPLGSTKIFRGSTTRLGFTILSKRQFIHGICPNRAQTKYNTQLDAGSDTKARLLKAISDLARFVGPLQRHTSRHDTHQSNTRISHVTLGCIMNVSSRKYYVSICLEAICNPKRGGVPKKGFAREFGVP